MSSGFVSEAEIAEARRRRQQEWELVRQPNQPLGTFTTLIKMLRFRVTFNNTSASLNVRSQTKKSLKI